MRALAICAFQPREHLIKLAKSDTDAIEDEIALEEKDALGYQASRTAAYKAFQDVAVSAGLG